MNPLGQPFAQDRASASPNGEASTPPGVACRQVSKRYGGADAPLVVNAVDFTVPRGTLTTLLGPSGCGKTTLLRLIAGLDAPSSGTILIAGEAVTGQGPAERNVSMVFQNYALFPHLSVIGNVAYGLTVSRVATGEAERRAREALGLVGLGGFERRMPGELSGGQQQRVALARALVLEPAVLLFDEPLSNLDARLRRAMRQEIRQLQQRLGLTVIYVTHDQSEALAVSDQVIVMNTGVIAQAGSPRDLYERPGSVFVASFMGEAMLFDGVMRADGLVEVGPLALLAPHPVAAGAVKVAVRPEAWTLAGAGAGLPGRIVTRAYLGSHAELSIATALGTVFATSTEVDAPWVPGGDVVLSLQGRGVSVVPA